MARENKTRYAILGLLSYGPMSGYDVKKVTDDSIAHFWRENFGQIYPVLEGLRKEGLVEPVVEPPETVGSPGRARKRYRISDSGREELAKWLYREPEQPGMRIELLLKLFFGRIVPTDVLVRHLESELHVHTEKLREYEKIARHIEGHEEGASDEELARFAHGEMDHLLWRATLSYGRHYSQMIVAWCNETIAALRSVDNR